MAAARCFLEPVAENPGRGFVTVALRAFLLRTTSPVTLGMACIHEPGSMQRILLGKWAVVKKALQKQVLEPGTRYPEECTASGEA